MKWIPTSERLPEPKGCHKYLVTEAHYNPEYTGRFVTIDEYEALDEEMDPYWTEHRECDGIRVVAWMTLPEVYRGEEDEDSN